MWPTPTKPTFQPGIHGTSFHPPSSCIGHEDSGGTTMFLHAIGILLLGSWYNWQFHNMEKVCTSRLDKLDNATNFHPDSDHASSCGIDPIPTTTISHLDIWCKRLHRR
jgi:hypothetical protein